MKFTLSWLKDHLETDASLDDIVETLTRIGLEVEAVDDRAAYKPFTIARVISAEPHTNADKLKVLSVDAGDGKPVQVVCGAPNARTGMKGVFAPAGVHIPGTGIDLKSAQIRGVASNGMLCSEREMGLSDEHEGIIELPEDAPVGALVPLASGRAAADDALPIHADATLSGATLRAGQSLSVPLDPGRQAYLVPAAGRIAVDGVTVETRAGAAVRGVDAAHLEALEDVELLFADLPGG